MEAWVIALIIIGVIILFVVVGLLIWLLWEETDVINNEFVDINFNSGVYQFNQTVNKLSSTDMINIQSGNTGFTIPSNTYSTPLTMTFTAGGTNINLNATEGYQYQASMDITDSNNQGNTYNQAFSFVFQYPLGVTGSTGVSATTTSIINPPNFGSVSSTSQIYTVAPSLLTTTSNILKFEPIMNLVITPNTQTNNLHTFTIKNFRVKLLAYNVKPKFLGINI